jgi:hypothetical protein
VDSKKIGLKETTNSESPWSKTKKKCNKKISVSTYGYVTIFLIFLIAINEKINKKRKV